MTRRRLSLMLAVAGVLIIAATIIVAAVMRASDSATVALDTRPDVPVVVTEPGVLDAVDSQVTARATAGDDEQVVLAIGRTSEVEAWLGDIEHLRVTGLSSWESLTTEVVAAPQTPTDAPTDDGAPTDAATDGATEEGAAEEPSVLPDPAGSDLWVVETVSTGAAELSWSDSPGRWSLVVATDGTGPAPEVELEWGRQVSTPWLVPGIVIGVLALVAGVTMLVLDRLARREQRRRSDVDDDDAAEPRSVTDTDPGTGERLTRRQIREMEHSMAQADRSRRAGEPVPPPVPLAADDDEHRETGWEHADALAGTDPYAGGRPTELDGTEPDGTEPVWSVPGAPGTDGPQPHAAEPDEHDEHDDLAPEHDEPEDLTSEDDDEYTPAPPSWRSVWGFGGAAAGRPAQPGPGAQEDESARPDQHDGEERR